MVGLGHGLEEPRGNDVGRVSRALHRKIFPGIGTTCESQGVPRVETTNDDGA